MVNILRGNQKSFSKVETDYTVEISMTERGREIFIHILNMTTDRRDPGMHGLSKISPIRKINLDIYCPSEPQRVTLEPQ